MTNAKNNETKQQELKSCPVAAALGVASKLREAKLDDDQCQSLAVKLPKDTDVIMIDVGDAVSFDDNLEAVEITAMEARGREAVGRYLEYDLPAEVEVSARHANY